MRTSTLQSSACLLLLLLVAAGLPFHAAGQAYRHDPRPDVDAYKASTAPAEILARTNELVLAARDGSLGQVPMKHLKVLDEASDAINDLLHPDTVFAGLSAGQRATLDEARQRVSIVMLKYHPNRVVCRDTQKTGSRVVIKECLTVHEALARKRGARETGDRMINNMTCIPGNDGGCARGN